MEKEEQDCCKKEENIEEGWGYITYDDCGESIKVTYCSECGELLGVDI